MQRIAVVVFGVLALLVVSTWLDRLFTRPTSSVRIMHYNRDVKASPDRLIVYLPGILVDGNRSCESVMEVWQRYGDVMTVSYEGDSFDAPEVVETVGSLIENDHLHGTVVLVGSSMGGLLAIDVVDWLQSRGVSTKTVDVICVDSPSGSRDMLSGGNISAPVMRILPFGRFYSLIGAPVMKSMLVPPKDENIEPNLDPDKVKRKAMDIMSRFPLSVWRDQLAYMAAHRRLSPADFVGLNSLVYLRCDRNNETVRQPQAADAWKSASGNRARVIGVDSTHCGYIERPTTWQQAFEDVLRTM